MRLRVVVLVVQDVVGRAHLAGADGEAARQAAGRDRGDDLQKISIKKCQRHLAELERDSFMGLVRFTWILSVVIAQIRVVWPHRLTCPHSRPPTPNATHQSHCSRVSGAVENQRPPNCTITTCTIIVITQME